VATVEKPASGLDHGFTDSTALRVTPPDRTQGEETGVTPPFSCSLPTEEVDGPAAPLVKKIRWTNFGLDCLSAAPRRCAPRRCALRIGREEPPCVYTRM